ncbi:hypothetical protein [Salipiger bermudensis]|uniref:hypothetical protein n=1 Tax=Salipiger bermudensis TaxID=344736 RepID=UPI000C91165C|nr:hypothetical protein [Salipiger bermudensis]MAE91732.1 hypothetical protein [Pelagibaca sp.]MBN9676922.1 hypothetical protein [Salipiger bermudensis]MBR9890493.1 hypothetical protein [bacterium]|tara:strand:- start:27 stop:371 length:345 start_codon:yes stop_codon:yes gene_type:complete
MDKALYDFDKRQRAVVQKHHKLASGYTTKLNRNGIIEHKPIRRVPFFSLKGLLTAVLGFLVFKGLLCASLGIEEYVARLAHLSQGSALERAGAWLMGADPASLWVASLLQPLFG